VKAALASLFALLVLAGCAAVQTPPPAPSAAVTVTDPLFPGGFFLWAPYTRAEAESLAAHAADSPQEALEAAGCYATLAATSVDPAQKGPLAEAGRKLALDVASAHPDSALAHYLAAALTGYAAESTPLAGLSLVPVIEREGAAAARLNPALDHAGPERLLGLLYLRAPGIPLSVGDSAKAVDHLERAVSLAPDFAENRLGLAEALLVEEEPERACTELAAGLGLLTPSCPGSSQLPRAAALLKTLCGQTAKP